MSLYAEIEKTFTAIEKFLSQEELSEFMKTPTFRLYAFYYNLAMRIKKTELFEGSRLRRLFLENNIEQTEIMLDTILTLFHYHMYCRFKKENQEKEIQRKGENTLTWCEKRQTYTYHTKPLQP